MKKFVYRKALLLSLIMLGQTTYAEDHYRFNEFVVNGNSHIPDGSILYYLGIKSNQDYKRSDIEQMVKKAYETGFFKKIAIDSSDKTGIITVTEQPIISEIKFYGNHKINDKDLEKNLQIKPGLTFSELKLKEDTEKILKAYQYKGYFNAIISPKIINEKTGGISIAFEIKEGKKAAIEKIAFLGDVHFPENDLKQNILSTEWAFYRFFSSGYYYDTDRVEADKQLIAEYYQSRGYPNAKVVRATNEIDAENKSFILTFFIDSGEKYNFGSAKLVDGLKIGDQEDLQKELSLIKQGKLYNIQTVREVIGKINNILARKGYAFSDTVHENNYNPETKQIDVSIIINPSQKFFVNKINIVNNTKTKDDVIRREIKIAEKDGYDLGKIELSIHRIRNLGYFDEVKIEPKQVVGTDKVDLDIEVTEKRTGTAMINGGYNTVVGPFFGLKYNEANFLGSGRKIGGDIQFANLEKSFDIYVNEPYFMGFDAVSGINLFYNKRAHVNKSKDSTSKHKYYVESRGISLSTTYNLAEYLKHTLQYSFKWEDIEYGDSIYRISPFLRVDTKIHTVSSIGHNLVYDRTDNSISPTKGYVLSLWQGLAGVGGNARYLQNVLSASHYTPVYKDKVVLKVSGTGGHVHGLGRKVRPLDNFYAQDSMIRGFAINGIGSRDMRTNDSLGGKQYFAGTAELKFPVGLPREIGINGVAFTDAATLYNIDVPDNVDLSQNRYSNDKALRLSYGFGIIWDSPLGMIRLNYGIPISKTEFDQIDKFNFSIGKSF